MNPLRAHWCLDPAIRFLNHGSFGATPRSILDAFLHLQQTLEREPVRFFLEEYAPRLDRARGALSAFVGARAENLVFVNNATTAVNSVLRSIAWQPGDEFLTTDHAYGACRNVLEWVAERHGGRVIRAPLPFPLSDPGQVVEALEAAVTPRTRLLLIDHITSSTALLLPLEEVVARFAARGIDVLVDGAHGPGMVALELERLGAAYYTGNLHKWVCAPKGAAFLYVRPDRQAGIHPAQISHGLRSGWPGKSQLQAEFDWPGTQDFAPWLLLPEVLEKLAGLVPGGWAEIRRRNRELAREARDLLAGALEIEPPAPDSMLGSMAALPLPDSPVSAAQSPLFVDPLAVRLRHEYGFEVPIYHWPGHPRRVLRVSAHLYNEREEYAALAEVLPRELAAESG